MVRRVACALLLVAGCQPSGGGPSPPADMGSPDAATVPPPDMANLDAAGSVLFDVTDDETGESLPVRVLVTAVAPTKPLRFDINTAGVPTMGDTATYPAPGVIGSPEGVMLISGAAQLTMPGGTYDLFICHGPEWEADSRRIEVKPRHATVVASALRRTVDTGGWMSADLHVHTLRSYDSKLQVDSRVVSEVSVGVQLIVTTDHNVFTDLQPDLEQFGYGRVARAFVGDEFNFVPGHGGAYPMAYDPSARDPMGLLDGGATSLRLDWDHVMSWHSADIFSYLRNLPTRPAVTVNHPRLLPDLGYFTNLGWAPPAPPPDAGLFDGIEVLSGYMQQPADFAALLRDWFFYLNTGTRITALGSSDTHRLRDTRAGFPRSWLRVPSDQPSKILGSDIADAIKAGRAIASNGPFALLTVDGAPIGDLVRNLTGTVMVEATVDAPAWIDVDKLRVFVNGKVVEERSITAGSRPLFHDRFPVKLPAGDAWVALQVGGSRPLRADLVGEHTNGMAMPLAITNPVYVDGDGDGGFKPAFARLADADPGPIAPLTLGIDADPWPLDLPGRASQPVPQDCEPPLWTNPYTFGR